MARPRKYKRPQIRRKCHNYVVHKVPRVGIIDIVPYSRKSEKTSRVELQGSMKFKPEHYCNQQCHSSAMESASYG